MFWTFLNAALLSLTLGIQPPANSNTDVAPKVVEWLSPCEHDFGTLRRDRPKEHIFQFKNIINEPIILQTVRTSCGCTAASWTETPIAPGETGEVRIEYDAYQMGDFSKKIKVFFDKQKKAEVLRIVGVVE